ncbi:MAG: glycosyltransferase family 2 protein [Planctomycetota bacterium]
MSSPPFHRSVTDADPNAPSADAPRPYFSIIVPVFNRRHLLEPTLRSLLRQTFTDFEAVIVDDASTDGSFEFLRDQLKHDPRFRVLRQHKNEGQAQARNRAMEEARGKYFAFLDSDDLMMPWTLMTYLDAIRRAENEGPVSFVAGSAVAIKGDEDASDVGPEVFDGQLQIKRFEDYLAYRKHEPEWWFPPSGMVVAAEAARKAGGFWKHRLGEDIDFYLRLGTADGFVRVNSPVTFAYRIHAGDDSNAQAAGSLAGARQIIREEQEHRYPGGVDREKDRLEVVTAQLRHQARMLARRRRPGMAMRLWLESAMWNLRLRHWKFMLLLPAEAMLATTGVLKTRRVH